MWCLMYIVAFVAAGLVFLALRWRFRHRDQAWHRIVDWSSLQRPDWQGIAFIFTPLNNDSMSAENALSIFILGLSNRHRRELFSSVALAVTR